MKRYKLLWLNLTRNESGQDLIEYALIVALIALGSVAAMRSFTASLATFVGNIGTTLAGAV